MVPWISALLSWVKRSESLFCHSCVTLSFILLWRSVLCLCCHGVSHSSVSRLSIQIPIEPV
jgi:hypothetical protein